MGRFKVGPGVLIADSTAERLRQWLSPPQWLLLFLPDLPSGFLPFPPLIIIQSFLGESGAPISPGLPEVSQVGRTAPAHRVLTGSGGGSAGGDRGTHRVQIQFVDGCPLPGDIQGPAHPPPCVGVAGGVRDNGQDYW